MSDHSNEIVGGDYGPAGNRKLLKGLMHGIPLSILLFWLPVGLIVWVLAR